MKFARFVLLTICTFVIFALTMTFASLIPFRTDAAVRAGLLALFGVLWLVARPGSSFGRFRPVFFACFTAVFSLSLGFFLADKGLDLIGLTTKTPLGVAMAKLVQASLIVIGILVMAKLSGQDLASLYIRRGRLILGLAVGLIGAGAFLALMHPPGMTALPTAKLISLAPFVAIFVLANAFMEELLFRGLFLGRFEPLMGKWLALFSTALAFTLAHMQVTYAPDMVFFLLVTFVLALAWGWLMQKTGSLWGSMVFHAGADVTLILPIFMSLGAA